MLLPSSVVRIMTTPRILTRAECLARLSEGTIGRVAISRHALPAILPVTYTLVDGDVVFGPGRGPGAAELHKNVIAFEADDIDALTGTGWSVVVVGVARHFAGGALTDLFLLPTLRISGRPFTGAVLKELSL